MIEGTKVSVKSELATEVDVAREYEDIRDYWRSINVERSFDGVPNYKLHRDLPSGSGLT